MSNEWLTQWLGAKQYVLSRQVSDHCEIVVKSSVTDWVRNHFVHLTCGSNQKDLICGEESLGSSYLTREQYERGKGKVKMGENRSQTVE